MSNLTIISADCHAGALPDTYREYLPTRLREHFDDWWTAIDAEMKALEVKQGMPPGGIDIVPIGRKPHQSIVEIVGSGWGERLNDCTGNRIAGLRVGGKRNARKYESERRESGAQRLEATRHDTGSSLAPPP